MALKQEIGENTNNHSNHLKKKVKGLEKRVDDYYDKTQVIRDNYQTQNQILNQLQEKVTYILKYKGKIHRTYQKWQKHPVGNIIPIL